MINLDDVKIVWSTINNVCGIIGFLLWIPFICRYVASYFRLNFKYKNLSFMERFSSSKEECVAINYLSSTESKVITYDSINCTVINISYDEYQLLQSGLIILATKGYVCNSDGAWGGSPPYTSVILTEKFISTFLWKE